ncbi:MAG: ParB/RepB/Spo0J family partition protein [Bryobacterales bacterium]|nr:ParB/RepB/Spo0J family partition protein [Bryobacterales bacterium]
MNKPQDNPRKVLGKGLAALLPTKPVQSPAGAAPAPSPAAAMAPPPPPEKVLVSNGTPISIPIDRIDPNPLQPRSVFQPDRLRELSQSIEANGIIQPIIVRALGDRYELIAGERRWRAARMAGLTEVPVVISNVANDHLLEVSLIENIQREDLNPIEVAQAFDRLHREHQLSHEDIARRTGKDRTTVTNTLRLLKLPPDVQLLINEHRLSMGQARAILGLTTPDEQRQMADKAVSQGMSVRQVERAVQKINEPRQEEPVDEKKQDPNVRAAAEELERALGTRVRIIEKSEQRGRIEIEYFSQDDLDRLYNLILEKK